MTSPEEARRRCKGQTCAWRTPQEHASWGVNADLLVQLVLREGELHGLADLLLLDVIASNVLHMRMGVSMDPTQMPACPGAMTSAP